MPLDLLEMSGAKCCASAFHSVAWLTVRVAVQRKYWSRLFCLGNNFSLGDNVLYHRWLN